MLFCNIDNCNKYSGTPLTWIENWSDLTEYILSSSPKSHGNGTKKSETRLRGYELMGFCCVVRNVQTKDIYGYINSVRIYNQLLINLRFKRDLKKVQVIERV